jgi:hypothetical protein
MAIVATLINSTPYHLVYKCIQDGAAGTSVDITNAELAAAAVAAESAPLKAHFATAVADSDAAKLLIEQLDPGEMYITPVGPESVWGASALEDGANLSKIEVQSGAAAAAATLVVGIKHSMVK